MKAILSFLVWSILLCRMMAKLSKVGLQTVGSPNDGKIIKAGWSNALLALVTGVVGLTAVLNNSIECLFVSFMHVDVVAISNMIIHLPLFLSQRILGHDGIHRIICGFLNNVFHYSYTANA